MARASATATLPRRRTALILGAVITAIATACASSSNSDVTSSGQACLARSASAHLALARVAFIGITLPGATVSAGRGRVLASPMRIRIVRYLKGSGPRIVTVITAATQNGSTVSLNEDGIQAQAGQRWRIYATTQRIPYNTSICAGSTRLVNTP